MFSPQRQSNGRRRHRPSARRTQVQPWMLWTAVILAVAALALGIYLIFLRPYHVDKNLTQLGFGPTPTGPPRQIPFTTPRDPSYTPPTSATRRSGTPPPPPMACGCRRPASRWRCIPTPRFSVMTPPATSSTPRSLWAPFSRCAAAIPT